MMSAFGGLWSLLPMTSAVLSDNKGPSAVCQQNFRTALTLRYFCGLKVFPLMFLYGPSSKIQIQEQSLAHFLEVRNSLYYISSEDDSERISSEDAHFFNSTNSSEEEIPFVVRYLFSLSHQISTHHE